MELYSSILIVHVISGFTALFVGLIPMFSKKGRIVHVRSGKVYFWAMFGVFLTSSLMFCFKPERLLFLFLVGVFSFYQTFSGARIVKYKKPSVHIPSFDKGVAFVMAISGIVMLSLGIYSILHAKTGTGIIYLVFGSALTYQGITDSYLYTKTWERRIKSTPKLWMYLHIQRMAGSYIATFTAFIVVNNTLLPPLVAWLGPGLIGGFITFLVMKKYKTTSRKQREQVS